jgi:hypothetical protein
MAKDSIKSIYEQPADAVNRRELDALDQIFDSVRANAVGDFSPSAERYILFQ